MNAFFDCVDSLGDVVINVRAVEKCPRTRYNSTKGERKEIESENSVERGRSEDASDEDEEGEEERGET